MLTIEYIDLEKEDKKLIDFVPDNLKDIPVMRAQLDNNFMVENPVKTLALKIESGEYNDYRRKKATEEIKITNELSSMWDNNSEISVMELISKLINKYVVPKALNNQKEKT